MPHIPQEDDWTQPFSCQLTRFKDRVVTAMVLAFAMPALFALPVAAQDAQPSVGSIDSWMREGQAAVADRLATPRIEHRAKNVILFVGDGMGISTLTAGRIYDGQMRGNSGEENLLSFEHFPYTALVKTYNVDAQVADSAGTASALNTGVKTRIGVINTAPEAVQNVCPKDEYRLMPLAHYAERIGMATGIVSTARLTHATPAAVYAVSPSRGWENDTHIPDAAKEAGCRDIAQQIVDNMGGNGLEVALGGGRDQFLPTDGSQHGTGKRQDGRNIVAEWLARDPAARFVADRQALTSIDPAVTGPLLGLFTSSHMSYELDRQAVAKTDGTPSDEPDLATMTETAIRHLSRNPDGFYLMVEGGRIDHAHHGGNAQRALADTVALSRAVTKALEMVDINETLILVTADHSHVFTMAGYPRRGNPILGLVRPAGPKGASKRLEMAGDGKPYTTLGYHNGPGAVRGERPRLSEEEVLAPDFRQQALIPTHSETHGGEDVALFGIGPWAHLVRGTMEQNVIFHIMDHALGLRERAGMQ
ncbi:alkaline phosphatase [Eilatimonas milleporae]|uniref:Alkaline phosphatase n=2 Tax=Eilatimonas milleporae TaxID=911205 RepID=A0A3M0CQ99_9PROT|nr:alkaline phosphatase [Eilatimonas milleporae]